MLVEAAWAAAKTPGPLRAFFERVRARRGMHIAVVATANYSLKEVRRRENQLTQQAEHAYR